MLCRSLGLRHREAATLTPRAFNESTNTISFKRKAGGTSNLPVPRELAALIHFAGTRGLDVPIIETLGCRSNTKWGLAYQWRATKKRAGADPRLVIHDLRRTTASALYDKTKDLRLVQQLLGHRDMKSTLHYIAPFGDPEALRIALPDTMPIDLSELELATTMKQ